MILIPVKLIIGTKMTTPKTPETTAADAPQPLTLPLPPVLPGLDSETARVRVEDFYQGIPELFEIWVQRRQSPETQRAYRRDVLAFVEHAGWRWPEEALRFLTVNVGQVQAYRDAIQERYSPKTVLRRLCSLSSWYRFLGATAAELRLPIQVPNPAHSQFIPRGTADAVTPSPELSIGSVRRLLALPEGDNVIACRDRAILAVCFYSGARIGAMVRLRVESFAEDAHGAGLRLHEKGDAHRTIGLHGTAAGAIRAYLAVAELRTGPLFRPSRGPYSRELAGRSFSQRGFRSLLYRYFRQLPDGARLRPHSTRATVATELLDAGTDPVKVQELLGHADIRTTLSYDRRRRAKRESASYELPY